MSHSQNFLSKKVSTGKKGPPTNTETQYNKGGEEGQCFRPGNIMAGGPPPAESFFCLELT